MARDYFNELPAVQISEKLLRELVEAFRTGVKITEGAYTHVSHGGPTLLEAGAWLVNANRILKKLKGHYED